MTLRKRINQRLTILFLSIFLLTNTSSWAQDAAAGKIVFGSKCGSCHIMGGESTGPNLQGVLSNQWGGNVEQISAWIRDYKKAVGAGYSRAVQAVALKSTDMQIFGSSISDKEIADVVAYIDTWQPTKKDTGDKNGGGDTANQNAVIFGVISLILAIIALILMYVNSNLKKLSDDAEGISRPEPVAFYRNKIYIAMAAIVFFVVGGYFIAKGAIGLGRQKDYAPAQPIFYSHKVHAGINQINCLYCHGNAMESKHATIPSVNLCMNCHKTIQTYEGPTLYNAEGEEVDGSGEIAKLYKYAGFDPKNAESWDASKATSIEWVKIHNLPDHVYFNHSQHVKAGNVQCQTCHGAINEMDIVKQASELSMGWCINCHRQTKVNFNYSDSTGNQFYSIYEKYHNDIKSGKMDSVTVEHIGGLECQKCHY